MADAYKGLVIEIDGNTTKLSASLRSVQSDIRGGPRAPSKTSARRSSSTPATSS